MISYLHQRYGPTTAPGPAAGLLSCPAQPFTGRLTVRFRATTDQEAADRWRAFATRFSVCGLTLRCQSYGRGDASSYHRVAYVSAGSEHTWSLCTSLYERSLDTYAEPPEHTGCRNTSPTHAAASATSSTAVHRCDYGARDACFHTRPSRWHHGTAATTSRPSDERLPI